MSLYLLSSKLGDMKKKTSVKVLQQLLKNSRKSDRELSRAVGVSQPTFSRTRQELEKKLVQEYTLIPDLYKLGFEILAFTFLRIGRVKPEQLERARKDSEENPNVIFGALGEGLGMHGLIVSVHEDYASYSSFVKEARASWAGLIEDMQSFLISLKGDAMTKPFSLKSLVDVLPDRWAEEAAKSSA